MGWCESYWWLKFQWYIPFTSLYQWTFILIKMTMYISPVRILVGWYQRIYISKRTDSTPPASSKQLPTQPLLALSAVYSNYTDCLTEQAGGGGGRGWVGKCLEVRSLTKIYSLDDTIQCLHELWIFKVSTYPVNNNMINVYIFLKL